MAFQKAAGYQNLPNGVFSPTIYSKKVQKTFRKSSVVEGITNSDYFGEISAFGDSVRIIKEPDVIVRPYARGTQITPQDLEDVDFSLIIDQANYFAFKVDDIEEQQSHVNWQDMAADRAAYSLRQQFDSEVLGYLSGYELNNAGIWVVRTAPNGTVADPTAGVDEWLAIRKLTRANFVTAGSVNDSIVVGTKGTYDATPLAILNRMNRELDLANVPNDGRWIVVDPVFVEKLLDEDSKLVNNDYGGTGQHGEGLYNGQLMAQKIRGFRIHVSNNLPKLGTGPGTVDLDGSAANYGIIVAGHDSAVATASQINKTESYRDTSSFADVVRGMQLYGRKILRPEAMIRAIYNINA